MILTIPEKLVDLLSQSNSLDYNKEELLSKYVEGVSEMEAIALTLCGTSGEQMALRFMQGQSEPKYFLENVSFSSGKVNPYVLRAINIHLMNVKDLSAISI